LVNCPDLKRGILKVYDDVHGVKIHPWVYISLQLEPKNLDVNVHPSKEEVHFLNEAKIISTICNDFRTSLSKYVEDVANKDSVGSEQQQQNDELLEISEEQVNVNENENENENVNVNVDNNNNNNNNVGIPQQKKKPNNFGKDQTKNSLNGGATTNNNNNNNSKYSIEDDNSNDGNNNNNNSKANQLTFRALPPPQQLSTNIPKNSNHVRDDPMIIDENSNNSTTTTTTTTTSNRISLPPTYVAPHQQPILENQQHPQQHQQHQQQHHQQHHQQQQQQQQQQIPPPQDDQPTGKPTEVVPAASQRWKQTQLPGAPPVPQISSTQKKNNNNHSTQNQHPNYGTTTQTKRKLDMNDKPEEIPGAKKRKVQRTNPGLSSIELIRSEIDEKADLCKFKEEGMMPFFFFFFF